MRPSASLLSHGRPSYQSMSPNGCALRRLIACPHIADGCVRRCLAVDASVAPFVVNPHSRTSTRYAASSMTLPQPRG